MEELLSFELRQLKSVFRNIIMKLKLCCVYLMQYAFQSHEAILLHLVSVSQSVIQSLNHVLSTLITALLSSSLTPANRSYASHVFSLRRSLSSTTPLLCGGHLRDRRDRTSMLPFRVLLPRMLQLCHLHGRVWTSHWRTRVWL